MVCTSDVHMMYEPNCPECNPEGYQALLNQAPQGEPGQPDAAPAPAPEPRATPSTHGEGYSDKY